MHNHAPLLFIVALNTICPALAGSPLGWPAFLATLCLQVLILGAVAVWVNRRVTKEIARLEARYKNLRE